MACNILYLFKCILQYRSFGVNSQACEAGLTGIQTAQLNSERGCSSPVLMNYMTLQDVEDKSKPKQNIATSRASLSVTNTNRCCGDQDQFSKSSLRDFFVVLALTFHAVFEGTAVGLENDVNDIWMLFGGMRVHKGHFDIFIF